MRTFVGTSETAGTSDTDTPVTGPGHVPPETLVQIMVTHADRLRVEVWDGESCALGRGVVVEGGAGVEISQPFSTFGLS